MTSEIDDIDQAIARLEALDAAATPGLWETDDDLYTCIINVTSDIYSAADAALIVSLRNEALPLLRRLRDERDMARRERDTLQSHIHEVQGLLSKCYDDEETGEHLRHYFREKGLTQW
jgi:hypothetical protein